MTLESEASKRAVPVSLEQKPQAEATSWLAGPRSARALDQLLEAVTAQGDLDDVWRRVLRSFMEVSGADVGVIRVREGTHLHSRVAVGLEEEVSAAFSHPISPGLAQFGVRPKAAGSDDLGYTEPMRRKGVRALYPVPLLHTQGEAGTELLAVVYLGAVREHELGDERAEALLALAPRAAGVIVQRRAYEALQQAVRSRDQVLAVVAHDLRNPINVISMAADGLLKRVEDSMARRPIERIIRAAQRADRLIGDLLEIDAIEGGRFSIEMGPVDTADVILAALESQQSLAASASVILATDLSPELPAVQGDTERLLEVLENLLDNAVKFTKPGGLVTVGASGRGNETVVWVKDSGSGIAADQLPHLFDRFWQAQKKDRRGTGLGLTICKAIVEAHGGRIWAESTLAQGTTLFFALPAIPSGQYRVGARQSASILLVDDRPENLLSLQAILERPDYRVVSARSGSEALSLVLKERFAVALIDIAMPLMNGLEVAVHLKGLERSRDIPIIFITAFGDDPDEIHRAYSAGGVDYLVKPLDPEIVRKKVAVFVDLSRRRQGSEPPRVPLRSGL